MAQVITSLLIFLTSVTFGVDSTSYCSDFLGMKVNPSDCRGYIHCRSHEMAIFHYCRKGFAFDNNVKICISMSIPPDCNPATGKSYDAGIEELNKSAKYMGDLQAFCSDNGTGIYHDPTDSTRGIVCLNNSFSHTYQCEGGTVFRTRPAGCRK